ncbi:MAG: hypothetical protein JO072_07900, partial [Parafilimonas sp.]|nr:hypothetical protein [Parafilimonas sp.]
YDLDKNYLPFHGMMGNTTYQQLKQISSQEKVGYILKIVGALNTSVRSRASFLELGQTILNFPQLASSVYLGGAICADTVRRILLGQLNASGRFYVDIDNIIKDSNNNKVLFSPNIPAPISENEMQALADKNSGKKTGTVISEDVASEIIFSAVHAPSSGNDQPWAWLYRNDNFFLFHNINRSYSFGDFNNRASYISLGSAIENFDLSAQHYSYKTIITLFPDSSDERLVAKISLFPFEKDDVNTGENLYQQIVKRHTNRKILPRETVSEEILNKLTKEAESVSNIHADWITDLSKLTDIGKIISACDRMRLLHQHGHYDFFNREIRWNNEALLAKKTGMGIDDLAIPNESLIALKFLSDPNVAKVLNDINGANALRNVSVMNTTSASAMCLITAPDYSPASFVAGGRAMERQWLKATELKIAYHPMVAPLYFFPKIIFGNGEGLDEQMITELKLLRKQFLEIFPGDNLRGEIALIRIFTPDDGEPKAPRLNLKDVFIFNK